MKVDLLIDGADILTQDPARPRARRVAILDRRIVAVDEECEGLAARRSVDATGAVCVPGFNDAHAHSVWFGMTLLEIDLTGCANLPEVYERIDAGARGKGPREWVIASGFNQMDTGGAYPDPGDLDRASGGRPVWIKHTSGHSCVISASALATLGVTGTENFQGGSVALDPAGRPSGVLEETAMSLVRDHLLPASPAEITAALAAAHEVYAAEGLTSVTDAGIAGGWIGHSPSELGAYQDAREQGALRARTQVMVASDVLGEIGAGWGMSAGIRTGFGDAHLSLGPVKIFLDGSILGNTARLDRPYSNRPDYHGYFQADPGELHRRATRAARSGWTLAMHAVGDAALDLAIDILTAARDIRPPMPHRIEHGGVVRPAQLAALARLGAPIVSQPHFLSRYGDGFWEYIGEERTHLSFPGASQLRAGLPLAASSDRPVAPGAPLTVMSSAIHRRTPSGRVYGPKERLTPEQALAAYTTGSAHVTGWDTDKGRLAPGYLADLVILDADPLTRDPASIRVLSTLVGGRAVFDDAGPFAGQVDR